jgi:release factor glutamine methyltransferase
MNIKQALDFGHRHLIAYDSARLDAELLLCQVLSEERPYLLAHDDQALSFWQRRRFRHLISRRKKGIPVAYLTGHKEFFGLEFDVNRHVLVPRIDTEILVECVTDYINAKLQIPNPKPQTKFQVSSSKSQNRSDLKKKKPLLMDVGTGSGCIPIALLTQFPELTAVVTDISSKALAVAKRNAKKHGVGERVSFFRSNLTQKVPLEAYEKYEVILTANLPYIPTILNADPSTRFEPQIALYGGQDGLDIYKKLMQEVIEIQPRAIFLELFEEQAAVLARGMEGYELIGIQDMTGEAKCMILERLNSQSA